MKLLFLGTGTSSGVPLWGCDCPVCVSEDKRDRRFRSSCFIETDGGDSLLIDCGPDFRMQALTWLHGKHIDSVLLTHSHYDHVGGLDDLRPFCKDLPLRLYASPICLNQLKRSLPYCFQSLDSPRVPHFKTIGVEAGNSFLVGNTEVVPLLAWHGEMPVLGFRIEEFAYLTDFRKLPESTMQQLQGIKHLVVGALHFHQHPTHLSVDEAIALGRSLNVKSTFLVHMSHRVGLHSATQRVLPENVFLAFDGMAVEL